MKPSEILKKAKKHLLNGINAENDQSCTESYYICNAVKIADGGMPGLYPATTIQGRKVVSHIVKLLNGCDTLSEWLDFKHGITSFTFSDNVSQLQATRLAWMDDMIQYWEELGQ